MTPASPCIQICEIQSSTGYCRGCRRTIEEIITWPRIDDARRQAILDALKTRGRAVR